MGTLTGTEIIDLTLNRLGDDSGVTYTRADALGWLNSGLRAIAILRPDSSYEVKPFRLTPGVARQEIDGLRLMDVYNNMGSDGQTPGNVINLAQREVMDKYNPGWRIRTADGDTEIEEYFYDERTPRHFWVRPVPHITTQVWIDLAQSISPPPLAAEGDTIPIDDVYEAPLILWMIYSFFSRDEETNPNYVRAAQAIKEFFNVLQVKLTTDIRISPRVREHLDK